MWLSRSIIPDQTLRTDSLGKKRIISDYCVAGEVAAIFRDDDGNCYLP